MWEAQASSQAGPGCMADMRGGTRDVERLHQHPLTSLGEGAQFL